jgi:thiol:disulfide interchange protein
MRRGEPAGAASEPRRLEGSTRGVPRALLVIAGALLVARVATGIYEERHPPAAHDLVKWRPIGVALAEARASGRPLLYDFTAEWCPPCRLMEREVFADEHAARTIETSFVPVRVLDRAREEGRNPPEVASLQARFGVTAFPTLVVVGADGGSPSVIEGYPGKVALMRQLVEAGVKSRRARGTPGLPGAAPHR